MFEEVQTVIAGFALIYLVVLMVLGVVAAKRMKNLEDYLLAGRNIGPWVLAFTFSATGMSGWLAMGFAGYVYESGFEPTWTMVPSATLGILLSFVLVSKLIRTYSHKTDSITIPDVLENRYYDKDKGRILRVVSMLVILAAALAYVNGQLVATGSTFETLMGWDYLISVVVAAIVFKVYTILGGLLAIAWTDFIQGILMVTGAALAGIFAVSFAGGFGEFSMELAKIPESDPDFLITPFYSSSIIILGITLFLGDGIMCWVGQPTLMVRYMSSRSRKTLNLTGVLAVFIQSILFFGTFLAALYMRTQYPTPDQLPLAGNTETVLIQFFTVATHPIFAGLFIGGLLAAIMSTADSMLLMGTSTIVNDVYAKMINPQASGKQLLFYGRIITVVMGLIALFMALDGGSVLWISWFGWGTLGLFFAPVVLGLWWKRATREGAISGLITGLVVMIIWTIFNLGDYVFPGFAGITSALIVTIAVSLFTEEPPKDVQDLVDETHQENRTEEVIEEKEEGVNLSEILPREKLLDLTSV
ncbi:sodium/proline symporter [Natranaerofaba carboxydovora]|uniref:sodium/proline symporter n=1 Tax=Natranaerofaba carboxydovora TaxID=2742683 RepID=UPI001F141FCF|nr:sodium/proline symporter [Natranaerofaba carboxydovora]UMZ72785.1 High-affinity proline transporter PutP [Natranaerofaba carboxydovora]